MNIYNSMIIDVNMRSAMFVLGIVFILSGCSESVNENKKDNLVNIDEKTVKSSDLVKKENTINKENNIAEVLDDKIVKISKKDEKNEIIIPKKIVEKEIAKITQIDINNTIIKKKVIPKEIVVVENKSKDEVKNEPVPIKKIFRDNINNIVIDNTTGLAWQDNLMIYKQWTSTENFNLANYSDTSGDTAVSYCNELSLGGFDDWKLPSIDNLRTIKKSNDTNETILNIFQNIKLTSYWTSTPYPGFSKAAWYINFIDGLEFGYSKIIHLNVRCVRDNI